MFTEERDSDVVKRVRLRDNKELFVISLIEHKSSVDYNVVMQLLRYMVYIWEDYEKNAEKEKEGIASTENFCYPPIIPIVYYEGISEWTACMSLAQRIIMRDVLCEFIPDFRYILVDIRSIERAELISKNDELSLVMIINKLKDSGEFKSLDLPEDYLQNIARKAPADVLDVIARVVTVILRELKLEENEVYEFTDQIKERKMGRILEHFQGYDVPATRREAREEGRKEGREEGREEERANTERERKRADLEKARADNAEAELARYIEKYGRLE